MDCPEIGNGRNATAEATTAAVASGGRTACGWMNWGAGWGLQEGTGKEDWDLDLDVEWDLP